MECAADVVFRVPLLPLNFPVIYNLYILAVCVCVCVFLGGGGGGG